MSVVSVGASTVIVTWTAEALSSWVSSCLGCGDMSASAAMPAVIAASDSVIVATSGTTVVGAPVS